MKLAAFAVAFATAQAAEVTPVQKVVQLMEAMIAKGKQDKADEATQYNNYVQFCADTTTEKRRSIEEATQAIDGLKADIEKYTNDANKLAKQIAAHEEDIAVWEGDKKAATAVRQLEKTDYTSMHTSYNESIDALGRAIAVLKKQAHDRKQADGTSLIEITSLQKYAMIPVEAKKTLNAFLQQGDADLAVGAPEAEGYEFQSSSVVEMLNSLLDKFTAERTALEKAEANSKHEFDMLISDLNAQLDEANRDRRSKSESRASKLQAKAQAEGDVTETSASRAEDQTYLQDLTATCEQKATDFAARQKLRGEELQAIGKAIEIISSQAVAGSADKHLPALVQSASFAQLRAGAAETQGRVAQYLKSRAHELNSRVLAAIAVRAEADPFVKVRKMIKELIARLVEEANEEAEHKAFCDTELATNEKTRNEKTQQVETLRAENDRLNATIAKLSEEISDLTQAIANLDEAMAKATEFRQGERAKNTQTIKDAQAAQTAVAQAMTVLKDFYAKAGEATSFAQQEPPESFDKPYQGMGGESGGVVGMLEVIESDFARLESDTAAAEANAQREYDTFMSDSKADKAAKGTDIENKTFQRQDTQQALVLNEEDLAGTQKELDAALTYYDELKKSCIETGVSYEDRVARREAEIQSLQEALKILNGEDLA